MYAENDQVISGKERLTPKVSGPGAVVMDFERALGDAREVTAAD